MNDLPSGWNESMAFQEALSRHLETEKKPFKLIPVYKILKQEEKYKLIGLSRRADSSASDNDGAENKDPAPVERPTGNKKAKKSNDEKEEEREGRRQQLAQTASQMAKAADERNRMLEDQIAMKLFQQNQSAPESLEFFAIKRAEYLRRLRARESVQQS
jgi:hypothetical protein